MMLTLVFLIHVIAIDGSYFTVTGDCDHSFNCVSSKNYPSSHGQNENCSVSILEDVGVSVSSVFSLEIGDHLIIRDSDVESRESVPSFLNASETFSWTTDDSVNDSGWELCFTRPTESLSSSRPSNASSTSCNSLKLWLLILIAF